MSESRNKLIRYRLPMLHNTKKRTLIEFLIQKWYQRVKYLYLLGKKLKKKSSVLALIKLVKGITSSVRIFQEHRERERTGGGGVIKFSTEIPAHS